MGIILSLSGPSGAGKTEIAKALIDRHRPHARMITSTTIRRQRPSDILGEYEYVRRADFKKFVGRREFLWTEEHGGEYYGTKRGSVLNVLQKPQVLGIMILVPRVVATLRSFVMEAPSGKTVSVFVEPEEYEVMQDRLRQRDGPSYHESRGRTRTEASWVAQAHSAAFFHFVKNPNGKLTETVDAISALLSR
jgi:guanylate kinase